MSSHASNRLRFRDHDIEDVMSGSQFEHKDTAIGSDIDVGTIQRELDVWIVIRTKRHTIECLHGAHMITLLGSEIFGE